MRFVVFALSACFAASAWAQDLPANVEAPPVVAAPTVEVQSVEAPAFVPPPAPTSAQTEVVCKRNPGTGSRLRKSDRRVCGTRAEWEDHNSELNRSMVGTIRSGTSTRSGQ